MEDRLEEAIHVLRSHAVGQGPGLEGAPDMHSLLSAVHNGGLGGLSPAFPNASLALSNRHPAMVSHLLCSKCVICMFSKETWTFVGDDMKQTEVFIYLCVYIISFNYPEISLQGVCFHCDIMEN